MTVFRLILALVLLPAATGQAGVTPPRKQAPRAAAGPYWPAHPHAGRRVRRKAEDEELDAWIEENARVVLVGETVSLTAGANPDEDVVFTWTLESGESYEGREVDLSFDARGVYRVTLTADDGDVQSAPFTTLVFVNHPDDYADNNEPTGAVVTPRFGQAFPINQAVTFRAEGVDPDGDAVTFYWDFGDGDPAEGPVASRTYNVYDLDDGPASERSALLFIRDARGLTRDDASYLPIAIYEGAPPPDGEITEPVLHDGSRDEVDYGQDVFSVREGKPLQLQGGLKGSSETAGVDGFWELYAVDEDGDDLEGEPTATHTGLSWLLDVAEMLPDREHVAFFYVSQDGVRDPVPDERFLLARVGNEAPEDVYILEPGWDDGYLVGEGVELGAFAYDDDGDDLTYVWRLDSIDHPEDAFCLEGERAYVVLDTPGLWRVRLEVSDPEGALGIGEESRYLWVYDSEPDEDTLPEVRAVSPVSHQITLRKGDTINFSAAVTVAPGRTVDTWHWDVPGTDLGSDTSSLSAVGFKQPGYRVIKASARDSQGYWGEPTYWEVLVFEDNLPPEVAIVSPPVNDHEEELYALATHVWLGGSVTFSGTGVDHDGISDHLVPVYVVYELEFDEGEVELEDECYGEWTKSLTFEEPGVFAVLLTAVDDDGTWAAFPDERIVIVLDPNEKPDTYLIEPADDLVVEPGEELYFFGFGEHPSSPELQLEWDFGGAQVPDGPHDTDVYPVVFDTPSPEGSPYVVSLTAKTTITIDGQTVELRDPTPATVRVTVRRFDDAGFEPNDGLDQAAPIQVGTYRNLTLEGGSDDADFFTFTVDQTSRDLRLALNAEGAAGNLHLTFYRRQGDGWAPWDAGRVDEADGRGVVTLEHVAPGAYAVGVGLSEGARKRRKGLTYSLSVATLEPALFLPFMVEDGNFSSKVGIINATGETADLAVQGLDAQGNPVACKPLSLPPHGRTFVSGKSLFGRVNGKDQARNIFWLKVSSTHRLLGYTNAESLDGKQLASVGAVRTLSAAALIPHVAQATDTWYTRAVMVNVDQGAGALTFESPGDSRAVTGALKAGEQVDFRFTDKFDPAALPGWGRFKNPDNAATLAGFELFGRVDGFQQVAALEMVDLRDKNPNFTQVDNNIYFTHIADTGVFWTGISLMNTGTMPATYDMVAYNAEGVEVARLAQQPMAVGEKLVATSAQLFPGRNDIAWLAVKTGFELAGFELFGDYDGKILSGFKATRFLSDTLTFPHLQVADGSWYTGIALLNVASTPVELELTLYDDLGTVLLQKTESLPSGRKIVRLAQFVFNEGLPATGTYLVARTLDGSRVLSGFEIFGTLDPNALWGELLGGLPALKD